MLRPFRKILGNVSNAFQKLYFNKTADTFNLY